MNKVNYPLGTKFNHLTLIEVLPSKNWRSRWKVRCDCGKEKEISAGNVYRGLSKSCGCLKDKLCKQRFSKHNLTETKEYAAWSKMKSRCYNKNCPKWESYGGRGIKVCDRWLHDAKQFVEDMGPRPGSEYSVERIDVNGDYEPSNCKWILMKDQGKNKRNTGRFIKEANALGVCRGTIYSRIYRGYTLDQATTSPKRTGPKPQFRND
jgi:hypothetical protein